MSSYLLSDEEFQYISNWLFNNATSNSEYGKAFSIKKFIGLDASNYAIFNAPSQALLKERVEECVRHLYNLNRLALVVRYSDNYDREDNKKFYPVTSFSEQETKAIKTLQALIYQCSEYLVIDTKLYESLERFVKNLCANIFNRDNR